MTPDVFTPALLAPLTGVNAGHRGVLSAAAFGLSDFIGVHGGDVERIFGASGIDADSLSKPTLSLELINYCRVMEEAARSSGFDNFGLHYGKQFKPQSLGLLGYIGLCSPTLELALHNMVNAFPYHQHNTLVKMVEMGDCWRLDYQIRHGAIMARRQDAELTLGMFMNLIWHVAGRRWAPREVHFEHPRPECWHEHCKVFDAPVYFEQPFNSLLLPKRDLKRPMPESDPVLLQVMQDAICRLNTTQQDQGIVNLTQVQMQLQLPHGEPTLEQVADALGMSSGSLQRRLRTEGVSFTALLEKLRCQLARHYLQQPALSVSEMAFLLGYSEISAFSRAFRRWFGLSPQQYRVRRN